MASHTVGIDFGTSTTLIAIGEKGNEPRVIPIGRTTPWMPSVAALLGDGTIVVGEDALQQDPRTQIRSIKADVTDGREQVRVGEEILDARTVLRAIVAEALARAERAQPKLLKTKSIYLGCPALWTGGQRRILADVVHDLGVEVDVGDIIDEPVAAGLHSVHSRRIRGGRGLSGRTVVFDAGGGTLDVAYIDVTREDRDEFTVLSAEGIPQSGDAVDRAIAEKLRPAVSGLPDPQLADLLLRERSREMKEALSRDVNRTAPLGAPYSVTLDLSREELEAVFEPQLKSSFDLTMSAVRGSELRVAQVPSPTEIRQRQWKEFADPVQHVVLVGGLSQMPVIAREIQELFPKAAVIVDDSPQESVVLGLAMGDQLNRLNLPRPPVNFTVEFGPSETIRRLGLESWANANASIYEAFTPLYSRQSLMLGETHLGYRRTIAFPPNCGEELTITIRAQSPDRHRTPLEFRVRRRGSEASAERSSADVITVSHSKDRPARFTLYTNGDLSVSGSKGESYRFRVSRWPILRGIGHDWDRERVIELERLSTGAYGSKLRIDDWRFN